MNSFTYRNGVLCAESVSLASLANDWGTPLYVYSRNHITERFLAYREALVGRDHLICYAVKANANLAVLQVLAELGAGFDIVSQGELERVLAAGGAPDKIVFSGVAKTREEMRRALEVGIRCFNVESASELERLNEVAAELGLVAPVSIRVNPDVDAQTHPYISTGLKDNKFGVDIAEAPRLYARADTMEHIRIVGVDCHIGSQLTSLAPFLDALDRLLLLVDELQESGVNIEHLDLGGGLGVRYRDETPPNAGDYIAALLKRLGERNLSLMFEPGRFIVANAGVLLTRVEYLKSNSEKHFAIVDAAMNDLVRPALYDAWMDIVPVQENGNPQAPGRNYDVVGPICESGDFLGKERNLAIAEGDLLAVQSAGAYSFTMSSNYNTRNRAAEVMVDDDKVHLVRERETHEQQFQLERLIRD